VSTTGSLLGTVRDLELDTETGRVVGLTVHQGGMLGLGGATTEVAATRIKSVGPELITVEG